MNTINEITATYQRIAEEGRSELNKVQNKIYRIGSLRLLLFVAGIAGIIYFWSSGWIVLTGIIAVTLLPFYPIDKVSQPAVSPERLSREKRLQSMSKNFRR